MKQIEYRLSTPVNTIKNNSWADETYNLCRIETNCGVTLEYGTFTELKESTPKCISEIRKQNGELIVLIHYNIYSLIKWTFSNIFQNVFRSAVGMHYVQSSTEKGVDKL